MKDPQGFCATSEAFFTEIMKSDSLKGFLFSSSKSPFKKSIFSSILCLWQNLSFKVVSLLIFFGSELSLETRVLKS